MTTYPRPKKIGGHLIREVIQLLRSANFDLPLSSHILIACSGGPDSLALAHLLISYGRRVIDQSKISLLHINHGWRGKKSDQEAAYVKQLARKWKVPVTVIKLSKKKIKAGESWEEVARTVRKNIFKEEAKNRGGLVFTAHHADDLAETLLWRLFTGSAESHGGGIIIQHGIEVRPFLRVRKEQLKKYLKEENINWCEDSTNLEGRFLRSKMRLELMPKVEKLFPRAVDHLIDLALKAQTNSDGTLGGTSDQAEVVSQFFSATGVRLRKSHWGVLNSDKIHRPGWYGEIHLPGGWRFKREKPAVKKKTSQTIVRCSERWVLEKLETRK